MLTLNDGRSELWQWDTGRKLTVDADCTQVHFSNKFFGRSVDVDVFDGTAEIPDVLLQVDKDLLVWAFVGTAENGYTKISKVFKVNKRNKPADYVFTPPEQTTLSEILKRLDDIESAQDPDAIKNAVNDYLANNPINVNETDPTVPAWAKQPEKPEYTAQEVGAVATVNGIPPDKNGDVKITIPDSSQNPDLTGVEPAEDDIPKVYFTGTLPTSKDDGDVKLTMRYISKTADFAYPVTLKVQGSSSANYPKKNFTLKPYKDSTYESKKKLAFKNWAEMNKFVLKAHWIDCSHVRNVGTAKIWGKVVASRSDYASLPEELRNSPNNGATDGFTCKVFNNGVYQGLYEWIVPKDKLFGQDSDIATHSILNSEWNNSTTCAFATIPTTIDGSWSEELQDELSSDISTSFTNLIKFVVESTDEEFIANAENFLDVQSVIDFDIFARVFCIVDNLCRNQIFFTYDGVKWYEGVWDVDAVLGLPPTTGSFFSYDTEFQTGYIAYRDYGVTNLLYQRVENCFLDRFKERYAELRSGVLSAESIIDVYERLTDVITTYDGLLAEDYASTTGGGKFSDIPYKTENNIQHIRNFVANRLVYMDGIVKSLTESVLCTGISLSTAELIFNDVGSQTIVAMVEPDNCTEEITWESSNQDIAFVKKGVVTAVSDGECTITARCGAQSATCTVTVSIGLGNILESVTWEIGLINGDTGADLSNDHYSRTAYFDISAYVGEHIALKANGKDIRIVVYDSDKTYLTSKVSTHSDLVQLTVPDSAKYARIAVKSANSTAVGLYARRNTCNYLDNVTEETGKYYSPDNGNSVTNSAYNTKRIPVTAGALAYFINVESCVVRDSGSNYISFLKPGKAESVFIIIDDNAAFMDINYPVTNVDTVCVAPTNEIGYSEITT